MAETKKKKAPAEGAESGEQAAEETGKPVAKKVDLNQFITVRNGFHGQLLYRSSRSGELYRWSAFGDDQEIELWELRNALSSAKSFFINNWFMFPEDWVIDWLGVRKYYRNAVGIDGFDGIFEKTPDEIVKAVSEMSRGQKKSLMYRALDKIGSGEIDSRRTIAALEEALGVELIEK